MQPEYNSVGGLVIPPPRRPIGLADLVGEWRNDETATTNYTSTSTGGYVGSNSVGTAETWNIDAKGGIKDHFKAGYSGLQGVRGVAQDTTGTVTIDRDGTIVMTYPSKKSAEHYIVRGWFVGVNVTMLKLNGPYYTAIAPENVQDPHYNEYMNRTYVRKDAPPR
jgi:hypothetical protein